MIQKVTRGEKKGKPKVEGVKKNDKLIELDKMWTFIWSRVNVWL